MSIERFLQAQDDLHAGYETALSEMRAGQKFSHWIWYIFPQLESLGRSSMAIRYGIRDVAEAVEYLRDQILRDRYREIAEAVEAKLASGIALEHVMGSSIDALKLVSSVTLFATAAAKLSADLPEAGELENLCRRILEHAKSDGYEACAATLTAANADSQNH
jgi:uncharacterized protein (DUF1810 family)